MIKLHLTGPLGTHLEVETTEPQMLDVLRRYGRQGWTSGEVPAGGLNLPYAMAETFDWSLIGAREYVNNDGEHSVIYRGQSYKRRELEAVDTKKLKMPAVIKYSRGARPTDPPHLKEGEEGSVQYVTLISFRGGGRPIESYLKQGGEHNQNRAPAAASRPQVRGPAPVHAQADASGTPAEPN